MARVLTHYVANIPLTCAQADVTSVAASATAVTILAARGERMGVHIFNDSTALLYLKYGSAASATSHTTQLQPSTWWEMPAGYRYTGLITGVWASATGSARVTEVLE